MRLVIVFLLGAGATAACSDPTCGTSGSYTVQYLSSQQFGTCALFGSAEAVTRAIETHPVIDVDVLGCYQATATTSYVDIEGCEILIEIDFSGDAEQEIPWDQSSGGFDATATCGTDSCTYQGIVILNRTARSGT
jgi:hypothetical protein